MAHCMTALLEYYNEAENVNVIPLNVFYYATCRLQVQYKPMEAIANLGGPALLPALA